MGFDRRTGSDGSQVHDAEKNISINADSCKVSLPIPLLTGQE